MNNNITVEERDIFDEMLKQMGDGIDITPKGIDWEKLQSSIEPLIKQQTTDAPAIR